MASINIRIDDDLKQRSFAELEKLGVTPSELLRQTLQYVAERGKLPFKAALLSEEDESTHCGGNGASFQPSTSEGQPG